MNSSIEAGSDDGTGGDGASSPGFEAEGDREAGGVQFPEGRRPERRRSSWDSSVSVSEGLELAQLFITSRQFRAPRGHF